MTKAILFRQFGKPAGFQLEGHAGYAPAGHDIVCSALSAITHMTAVGLTEVLKLKTKVSTDEKNGSMRVLVHPEDADRARTLLQTLEIELGLIAEQYPEHIRIIYAERREFKCFS